jgi:epoxyqueuosine reductase
MPTSTSDLRTEIREAAAAEGFDAVRIAPATSPPESEARLKKFLAAGYHGTMDWLAANAAARADPAALWPEAKSIVVLGVNYGPEDSPGGAISVYAQGGDYHDIVKKKLKRLAGFLVARFGGETKVFVDTAPVLEKAIAEQAGLGWMGKHTNLVSRDFGSWLFLGSVFTTLEITPDTRAENHCGACHACLDACPTRAFVAPYRMDARRCISYLTIEYKGHIPREFRVAIGNRIYGCDECLAVCPWNKFAKTSHEMQFLPRSFLRTMTLAGFAALDDAAFRALFRASPVKRIGRDRFVRNVLIAIGNSGDAALAGQAERLLADASPLVRGAAVWAASRLCDTARFAALGMQYLPRETNENVKAEWHDGIDK